MAVSKEADFSENIKFKDIRSEIGHLSYTDRMLVMLSMSGYSSVELSEICKKPTDYIDMLIKDAKMRAVPRQQQIKVPTALWSQAPKSDNVIPFVKPTVIKRFDPQQPDSPVRGTEKLQNQKTNTRTFRREGDIVKRLPDNEASYFMGLNQGVFQRSKADIFHNGRKCFVLKTGSTDERKKEQLKNTLGRLIDVDFVPNNTETKIYLPTPEFEFMRTQNIDIRVLHDKSNFAPFMLGLLQARLTAKEGRLWMADESLFKHVRFAFEKHFGFSLGNLRIELRDSYIDTVGETKKRREVIYVNNIKKIYTSLLAEESVKALPFYSKIKQMLTSGLQDE